jgi:hypothetical protein
MSNEPHARHNGYETPQTPSLLESVSPHANESIPALDDTLGTIPGKATSVKNQVLKIRRSV